MLYFDVAGRLNYEHGCEGCLKYPLEDLEEPCLLCGYSQKEIEDIHSKVEAMNEAYEKYGQNFEENPRSKPRNAFLHLSNISLGGDFDTMVLTDIDMNDDIREMADLTEHMVEIIVYPTDIVNKCLYDDDDEYWEEDNGE
jgi:hypothetical protein